MATVAEFVLARLVEWGVRWIYGYPGDGINGFLGALDRADGEPSFVQARHEEMAAFMACGHAKFGGGLGVCLATSGPGAIHLLNGLYDAKLDGQPVLALVGQQRRAALGAGYQQEVDLQTLFGDVSAFVETCTVPAQARHLVDRAARTALADGVVTTLVFPNDVQDEDAVESPPRAHGSVFSSVGYARPHVVPAQRELERAAGLLNAAERVAILAGRGAAGATDELIETADLLGAGAAKALLGKAVLPDDLPFVTGPIGLLGSRASFELMEGCDALLMVGSNFPYAEWLPREGRARGVQIDVEAARIGLRYPMDVHLVGDARDTLTALIPLLERKRDRAWREQVEAWVEDWWRIVESQAAMAGDPLNPQLVAWELNERLPDGAVLTADSGSSTVWWARCVRVRRGMLASLSGGLASMGSAVPYAIAAKNVRPDRPVIAFVGDGAFQMNGMNELATAMRHWDAWDDPRFVVAVFSNGDLNMVTWEQRVLAGDPAFPASQWLPDVPAAAIARLLGLYAIRCDAPDRVGPAWDEALAAGRPALVEFVVDPEIPPLPPRVSITDAANLARAMVKGDPQRAGVIEKSLLAKVRESRTLGRLLSPNR
ncbi:MAG TPA: thiamine pyrophosphate-requiring protein [Gaiellaceae bacterium]